MVLYVHLKHFRLSLIFLRTFVSLVFCSQLHSTITYRLNTRAWLSLHWWRAVKVVISICNFVALHSKDTCTAFVFRPNCISTYRFTNAWVNVLLCMVMLGINWEHSSWARRGTSAEHRLSPLTPEEEKEGFSDWENRKIHLEMHQYCGPNFFGWSDLWS